MSSGWAFVWPPKYLSRQFHKYIISENICNPSKDFLLFGVQGRGVRVGAAININELRSEKAHTERTNPVMFLKSKKTRKQNLDTKRVLAKWMENCVHLIFHQTIPLGDVYSYFKHHKQKTNWERTGICLASNATTIELASVGS